MQEGGDDPGQLKKSGRLGTLGVLTNIYFLGLFFILRCSLCGLHLFTGGEGQAGGGVQA